MTKSQYNHRSTNSTITHTFPPTLQNKSTSRPSYLNGCKHRKVTTELPTHNRDIVITISESLKASINPINGSSISYISFPTHFPSAVYSPTCYIILSKELLHLHVAATIDMDCPHNCPQYRRRNAVEKRETLASETREAYSTVTYWYGIIVTH